MPITSSAKKAVRGSKRKHALNLRRKGTLKTTVKDVKKLITTKAAKEAEDSLPKAYQAIDKALKRGLIKKNTAARKKSRLVKAIRKIAK